MNKYIVKLPHAAQAEHRSVSCAKDSDHDNTLAELDSVSTVVPNVEKPKFSPLFAAPSPKHSLRYLFVLASCANCACSQYNAVDQDAERAHTHAISCSPNPHLL